MTVDTRRVSRRGFLKRAAAAGAGAAAGATSLSMPTVITSGALGAGGGTPASDRIAMGAIGLGGRGMGDMAHFMAQDEVRMLAVCEVQRVRRQAAKAAVDRKYGNRHCAEYFDLRELLARADIDAVLIATGDNWHSLAATMAAKARKHIYCEKPVSVTMAESRALANAVKRHAVTFQCGMQRRSERNFQWAIHLARSGALGRLTTLHAERAPWFENVHQEILAPQPQPPVEEMAWDLWLGPAPWRPYNATYHTRGWWSADWDFSGGSLPEWGSHTGDMCQWANDADNTSPVHYEPQGKNVTCTYANGVRLVFCPPNLGRGSCAVRFEGAEGWVVTGDQRTIGASRAEWQRIGPVGPEFPATDHVRNFLDCVRTGQTPVASAEVAHRSISASHCANISLRLGRAVRWDPAKEEFVGDDDANRLRGRAYRQPWETAMG
jgi:predicted dehydrogenase